MGVFVSIRVVVFRDVTASMIVLVFDGHHDAKGLNRSIVTQVGGQLKHTTTERATTTVFYYLRFGSSGFANGVFMGQTHDSYSTLNGLVFLI